MRPSQTLSALEVLFAQQTGHLYRKGVRLSPQDSETTRDVYLQWVLLLVDLGYLTLGSHKANVGRIVTDMLSRDIYEVLNACADCVDIVRYRRKDGFKAHLSKISPHLYKVLKGDFDEMICGNVYSAKKLIQLFSYMGRLSLVDIDLTDQCLSDYRETERNMQDNYPADLIKSLRKIIHHWMSDFDPSDLQFGHGPGAVSGLGRTSLQNKYKSLFSDPLIHYAFRDHYMPSTGAIHSAPDRISQTIFVPKSYKTFRTISMEPSTLMYLQQGVWREIDRVVDKNRYLRDRIGFHDQVRNQKLALRGSIYRDYSTIDLSAASDSVSWALVRQLFQGTKVYRYLLATRSRFTMLPDGELLFLKKFAPMGSALCFPIETIIFAAICEHITFWHRDENREHVVRGDYSVFGDDIIVPTGCSAPLISALQSLGFTVNTSKSFYNKEIWFRESCGAEYCDGFDVTPLRVSRNYSSQYDDVSISGCVELANSCYLKGFMNLRSFFIKRLQFHVSEEEEMYIPLFNPTNLMSDNYSNYHTKIRYNSDFQRYEVKASKLIASPSKGNQELAYRHWLESTQRRKRVVLAFSSNVGEGDVNLRIRYQPFYQEIETLDMVMTESNMNPVLLK